jgi:hypothetical protein
MGLTKETEEKEEENYPLSSLLINITPSTVFTLVKFPWQDACDNHIDNYLA